MIDDYVGANFGHDETSDGELVQGSYYVALPDGRFQTVIMLTLTTPHYVIGLPGLIFTTLLSMLTNCDNDIF